MLKMVRELNKRTYKGQEQRSESSLFRVSAPQLLPLAVTLGGLNIEGDLGDYTS